MALPPDSTKPEGRPYVPFGIGLCGKMFTGGRQEEAGGDDGEKDGLNDSAAPVDESVDSAPVRAPVRASACHDMSR